MMEQVGHHVNSMNTARVALAGAGTYKQQLVGFGGEALQVSYRSNRRI
jgi:hypothetical protein